MAKEINTATNDHETQARIRRSWHLQDLLIFPSSVSGRSLGLNVGLKNTIQTQALPSLRRLGHASLCGVLYVAYQSNREVLGSYMLCALFESYMLLARLRPWDSKFEILAIISLGDMQLDKADCGRGEQSS